MTDFFWAIIDFICVFFSTMFSMEKSDAYRKGSASGKKWDGGGPGGPGGGPYGGGGPRRGMNNVRGLDSVQGAKSQFTACLRVLLWVSRKSTLYLFYPEMYAAGIGILLLFLR